MLRSLTLTIALTSIAVPQTADARLFWQSYGATVATADGCGCGCAWNINQDYFVPRHCHSGRYGLFSPCKSAHSISPACKNLHPVYAGYCTPYGSCRYKWRDHVYRTYCNCGPLKHQVGSRHLGPCWNHPLVLNHSDYCLACDHVPAVHPVEPEFQVAQATPQWLCLCNVEPFGGETLGSISALAAGPTSASAAAAPMAGVQPLPPQLNLTPTATPASGLPAPFNF